MTFRKILVPLAGIDEDAVAFDAARRLGSRSDAHIEALLAIPVSAARLGSSSIKQAHESSVEELRARVRALYRNCCSAFDISDSNAASALGLSARLVEKVGSEAELIACHGRLADLIVLARPAVAQHAWPNLSLETALRETGRPVLLVPAPVYELGNRVRDRVEWFCRGDARTGLCFADPPRRLKRSRSDRWATQRPPFWICGCRISRLSRDRCEKYDRL